MVIENNKITSFPIPNKYISNYTLFDNFEFEVISRLCQRKDIKGYWKGHIKGLLNFSNIDVRYKNKALQFIRSVGGNTNDKDYIDVYVNGLFDFNSNTISNYLLVDYDVYNLFDNKELFKYYCYMLYNVKMFGNCFIQTYKQLVKSTGISEMTIIKYNKKLMDLGLIYYVNSGDMYDKSTKTVVNSSNFYSTDLSFATSEMESYVAHSTDNYKWKRDIPDKVTPNDKRRASQFIRLYANIDKDNLNQEQNDKLLWAYELQIDINRVDYSDSDSIKKAKINSLVERYKKQGLDFDYSTCEQLIDGVIKIKDLV